MVNSDYSCDINKDIHDHKIVLRIAKFRLSSPRLELGISRVSGGRINQLSHEDASSFRSLPDFGLHIVLTQSKIALVKREKVVQRAEGKRKGSARLEKGFKPNRGS